MITQQLSGSLAVTIQSILFILLICSIILLFVIRTRISSLLTRMSNLIFQNMILQKQLHEADEKQNTLMKQLQAQQIEMQRFEQATATIIDRTTGLPNHNAIMGHINAELSRCARQHSSCAVLFAHLDSFQQIYKTWGQDASDTILREAASRLQLNTRTEDFLGQYSRENFILLLVETDLAGAVQAAERLRVELSTAPYFWSSETPTPETRVEMTASIGIAAYGLHGGTTEALIQHAATAMHYASRNGGNSTRVSDVDEGAPAFPEPAAKVQDNSELSTINALTAAASAHHKETDKHSHRLVHLAEETARELGCTEQEMHLVRLSALLHDIGKIGIPGTILDKPGPLTDEEWEIMRLHPQIGQRILCQVGGIFSSLSHVIVAHHERWDGKGYPMGLSEHDIPIEARILTVVDAFDAMISQRTYRQPVSIEEARLELLRCAGSQFDPEVVIAFLRVLNRLEQESAPQETIEQASIPAK